jgi:hypothetical protein
MRSFGGLVLALGAIALIAIGVIYLIKGGVWIGENILPWLLRFSMYALWLAAVCLVLALFPSQRGVAGYWLSICSIVFGITLWLIGLIVTYIYWGVIGVAIGLFLLGIGVVAVAALAALFNGNWPMLGVLLLGVLLTFGARWGGMLLIANARDRQGP